MLSHSLLFSRQLPADSISNLLNKTKDASERIRLQEDLFVFRDTRMLEHAHLTGQMALSRQQSWENAFQIARLYARLLRQPDSADKYIDQVEQLQPVMPDTAKSLHFVRVSLLKAGVDMVRDKRGPAKLYSHYLAKLHFFNDPRNINRLPSNMMAEFYIDIARLSISMAQWDSASIFIQRGQVFADKCDNKVYQYRLIDLEADLAAKLGDMGYSLELLRSMRPGLGHYGLFFDMAMYYSDMATTLLDLGLYREAILFSDSCLQLATTHNYQMYYNRMYCVKAFAYTFLGDSLASEQYMEKYRTYCASHSANRSYVTFLYNLAVKEYEHNDYKAARRHLSEALKMTRKIGDSIHATTILLEMARIENLEGRYTHALSYIEQVGPVDQNLYTTMDQLMYYRNSRIALENLGRYKEAFFAQKHERLLQDSMHNQDVSAQLVKARTEAEHHKLSLQLMENEQLLKISHTEKRVLSWMAITGFSIFGLLVVLLILQMKNRKQRAALEASQMSLRFTKLQLKTLQSQINPHFIFNSLNTFQYLVRDGRSEEALELVGNFAQLMRDVLNNSGEELISLTREITALSQYVEIEKARINKPLDFSFYVAPDINPNHTLIPPMLIQPLIENALWHGIAQEGDESRITVAITRGEDKSMIIEIVDNGKGYDPGSNNTKRKSYGISNVRERLENISSIYNQNASLSIVNLRDEGGQGTRQTVVIPFLILNTEFSPG